MNIDIFKNPEFDNKIKNVTEELKKCLTDKQFELIGFKVEELIQWHDLTPKGPRKIYPHTDCPTELINIISEIIIREFKE